MGRMSRSSPKSPGGDISRHRGRRCSTFLQGVFDQGLPFFDALCLHTRQGFYCDPVYGGNRDQVGWKVIGFPGPKSLKDTMDGAYDTHAYFEPEYDWEDLVPYLAEHRKPAAGNDG